MRGTLRGAMYVGWECREEQGVILALQQHIVLLSIITAGMDFYNSILELSKVIFLSPSGYIELQGGMGLRPNPSGHHIALATDRYRGEHILNLSQ